MLEVYSHGEGDFHKQDFEWIPVKGFLLKRKILVYPFQEGNDEEISFLFMS